MIPEEKWTPKRHRLDIKDVKELWFSGQCVINDQRRKAKGDRK